MHPLLRTSLLLACGAMGCRPSPQPRPLQAGPGASWQTAPGAPAETYRPSALRQASSAMIYLAGSTIQRLVSFEVVDGMAVMDGDIVLGPATFVPFRFGLPRLTAPGATKGAVARTDRSDLWPRGEIPFEIDASVPAEKRDWVAWCAQHLSQTPVRLRPAITTDEDRVVFRDSGENHGCYSYLGRNGGQQEIQLGGCGVRGSVLHEILHAAGFYHEQSRGDRDQHVTIYWDEIDPDHRSNFEMRSDRGSDIGAYDYGSIMHYSSRAFSRTGKPTIVPTTPGVTIGQREGLSSLDRAALDQLYAHKAPTPTPTGTSRPAPTPTTTAPTPTTTAPPPSPTTSQPFPGLPFPWPALPFPWTVLPTPAPTQPQPAPTPPAPPQPPTGMAPYAGNYDSTRGPMACTESASMVACSFQEAGAAGRLDCLKERGGMSLSCSWMTFFPRPAAGRASFTRPSAASRDLQGSWGHLQSNTGGGAWNATSR